MLPMMPTLGAGGGLEKGSNDGWVLTVWGGWNGLA